MDTEASLRTLQTRVRQAPPRPPVGIVLSRVVPDDLATENTRMLHLFPDEYAAFEQAKWTVTNDLRFEHLKDPDDAIWRFVCQSFLVRTENHVPEFAATHARDLLEITCYFPVEHLATGEVRSFGQIAFLPLDDPRLPPAAPGFHLDPPVGCAMAVVCRGTHYGRMASRGRQRAEHTLRALRIALREHPSIAQNQLRFRLTTGYSFGANIVGWRRRADEGWQLVLNEELVNLAASQPVASLHSEPSTDLERKAHLAMTWIERAWLASEPLAALLFLFFALEAVLGDKSEGKKAEALAIRQATLDHAMAGGFTHPSKTYLLYDEVRSAAVHGEQVPMVDWDDVTGFSWEVRRTLTHSLVFARERGLTKRSALLKVLDAHDDLKDLLQWLCENDPDRWLEYCQRRLAGLP